MNDEADEIRENDDVDVDADVDVSKWQTRMPLKALMGTEQT